VTCSNFSSDRRGGLMDFVDARSFGDEMSFLTNVLMFERVD
jgi:hypothetical protein